MKNVLLMFLLCLTLPFQSTFASTSHSIGPAERPATIKLPKNYSEKKSYPLILMLHGYSNTVELTDFYLGTSRSQDGLGYLLLLPSGLKSKTDGKSFWNAIPACCDFANSGVDDSAYLTDLVKRAQAEYKVDANRIYIFGHSNGGFMAHRLACDNDGLFKGIVSVAGSVYPDPADCKTETPINVLQVHGTEDPTVPFDTEGTDKAYPGAFGTVEFWAERNQCKNYSVKLAAENLVLIKWEIGVDKAFKPVLKGDVKDFLTLGLDSETDTFTYDQCAGNVRTALWRVNGGGHAPIFTGREFVKKALNFLDKK
ncbi:MAG: prolyl oligopeptidase family serine peptidase [Oligoflexus sp.]|nr:prolyl oligopeptidase family serine peptidase [Oligoflexus sp.]